MENKKSKELNTKNERSRLLVILAVIVLIIAAGLLFYLLGDKQGASGANSEQDANIVLSKVKMSMTKDEVIATVGQPRSCNPPEKSGSHVMEQCYYGKEDADGHAHVTFLDGKVWGTTYEKGVLPAK